MPARVLRLRAGRPPQHPTDARLAGTVALAGALAGCATEHAHELPGHDAIAAEVARVMQRTHAQGLAVAVIDGGQVRDVGAWGPRNARGEPLTIDTVMYGASLTKTVFAYTVLQLVDHGRLALDAPLGDDLDRPLPDYAPAPSSPTSTGRTRTSRAIRAGWPSRHACA